MFIDILNQSKLKAYEELSTLKLQHNNLKDEMAALERDQKIQIKKLSQEHEDQIEEYQR